MDKKNVITCVTAGIAAVFSLFMLIPAPTAVAGPSLPVFSDHPVKEQFPGKPAPPDLASAPDTKQFATRIREGATLGPNFAGHFTIIDWGCGTDCQSFVIVDAKTGAIYLPSITSSRGLLYRLDSSLLIVNPVVPEFLVDGKTPDWLVTGFYRWDGKKLNKLGESRNMLIDQQTGAATKPEQPKRWTVIDYYNATTGEDGPKIVENNGSWRIESPGGPITLTVADIPNGYIEFNDPGTGGGSSTISAALFLRRNGEPMIAVLEAGRTTGTCPDPTYMLKMAKMDGDRMEQIPNALPALPVCLFLKKGYEPKKSAPHVAADSHYRIGYRLPRKGTTIEAFLETSNLSCGMSMAGGDMPKKEREEQESFLQNVRKEPVKLKWNKDTGRFGAM